MDNFAEASKIFTEDANDINDASTVVRVYETEFALDKFKQHPIFGNGYYRANEAEKVIGEASTSYLTTKEAAKEIYKYNKTAKVVIILRDPISRTMSHYNMDRLSNRTSGDTLLKCLKTHIKF